MKTKQLIALFICNLVPFLVGNLLLALLPIYAIELGASETIAGIYLGLAFATLAIGTLLSGWLSDRFQRLADPLHHDCLVHGRRIYGYGGHSDGNVR
jgi:MFS family permease